MFFLSLFLSLLSSLLAGGAFAANESVVVDALVAKVGNEYILLSDTKKFNAVDNVLICAGLRKREKPLPENIKILLDIYVDEELVYLEAKERKLATVGMISAGVKTITAKPECKAQWQKMGEKFGRLWKSKERPREGESQLIRELEKRLLIDKFRVSDPSIESDIWNKEIRVKHPVKIFLE